MNPAPSTVYSFSVGSSVEIKLGKPVDPNRGQAFTTIDFGLATDFLQADRQNQLITLDETLYPDNLATSELFGQYLILVKVSSVFENNTLTKSYFFSVRIGFEGAEEVEEIEEVNEIHSEPIEEERQLLLTERLYYAVNSPLPKDTEANEFYSDLLTQIAQDHQTEGGIKAKILQMSNDNKLIIQFDSDIDFPDDIIDRLNESPKPQESLFKKPPSFSSKRELQHSSGLQIHLMETEYEENTVNENFKNWEVVEVKADQIVIRLDFKDARLVSQGDERDTLLVSLMLG